MRMRRPFVALASGLAILCAQDASAGVFRDFGVGEVVVTPQGDAGLVVTVTVEIAPGPEATEQPIPLRLLLSDGTEIPGDDIVFGHASRQCCSSADDCDPIAGYYVECRGSCDDSRRHSCVYIKKRSFAVPSLGDADHLTALLDPEGLHKESAPGAADNNSRTAFVPPNEPTGGIFYDFGVTGLSVAPGERGYRVDVGLMIAPEVVASGRPLALTLWSPLDTLVAEATIDTAEYGVEICCRGKGPCVSQDPTQEFICQGDCTTPGSQLPMICHPQTAHAFENLPLVPGAEIFVFLDRDGGHTETAVGAAGNNVASSVVP